VADYSELNAEVQTEMSRDST